MKLIAIGDLHGRENWKKITSGKDFDKVVFIGDYFDTHENISAERQKENFRQLITFKKTNIEKTILLFGNHDYHYLRFVNEYYSGFQPLHKTGIQELLHQALDEELLQMCFVYEKFLFIHAGVTKTWCAANNIDAGNPEQAINELFRYGPEAFRFTIGQNHSLVGDDINQSPTWVRPHSLLMDGIEDYIQVVGHTVQERLLITDKMILIDVLGTSGEYLQILDGEAKACLP